MDIGLEIAAVQKRKRRDVAFSLAVIPGRALARPRNLEIPGSMLCIAPE
jgi:hypothetical protein